MSSTTPICRRAAEGRPRVVAALPPCGASDGTAKSLDTALLSAIQCELCSTDQPLLFRIDVRVDGAHVELHGRVPSYYLKQLAQEAVLRLPDVTALSNKLEVGE